MISFEKFTLKNGLRVIYHHDKKTPLTAINILYDVGARDEDPDRTGFAHLFEHLMFGGSENIPSYDEPLESAGGDNNAFTNNDITNYYLTIPTQNIETGFWLESDRMLNLAFTTKSLDVQRQVVVEEFKQRYFNQPYGDVWLKLRPLAYKKHPYKWATIGKEISHIENATDADVKAFFFRHYVPSNAILVVAGNVTVDQVTELSKKWFEPIQAGKKPIRNLEREPIQNTKRVLETKENVPANALYKAFHMCGRFDPDYYATDLLSDVLSRGHSSRLYHQLVTEKEIFASISSFALGTIDPGLLVISGRVRDGINLEDAELEVDKILQEVVENGITEVELEKVKNQAVSTIEFGEVEVTNRALALALAALSGDTNLVNTEKQELGAVTVNDVQRAAKNILREENSSVLYYKSIKQE